MKKIYALIIGSLLLASCGGEQKKSVEDIIADGDLTSIKSKRSEVVAQQKEISEKIRLLDDAIAKLDTQKKLPLVTTLVAEEEVFDHYLEIQGNVATKQNILLYPEYSGVLEQIYVKEGQKVVKGQLLARIADGGLSQQLAQLQIQADLAKTTY